MRKRKVLITGGGGYIGSVATYIFLQQGFSVVVSDNFSHGFKEPLKLLQNRFGLKKLHFYDKDIRGDLDDIFEKEAIDLCLHFAGVCQVDESIKNPAKYFSNNTEGSINLLSTMVRYNVKKVIFSSTCVVYGQALYLPVDEKHPTKPVNPYGHSKLMVEEVIDWYSKAHGLKYIILRYFNVCGASDDGLIGDSQKPSVRLVQAAIRGALGIEPFSLTCARVDTHDGTPIRDYINVTDLNNAHLKAADYLFKGGNGEIINLGTGQGHSVLEIINAVKKVTNKEFRFKRASPRKGEAPQMVASIKKAKKILGWQPERTMEDSIRSLVIWYESYPQGWSC